MGWSKMELKKTFEGFLNVLNVLNMSHGNGSSAFVFQVMGILKPVTVSTDKGLRLSHSHMVGCNSLYGSNFDFRMTIFSVGTLGENHHFSDVNYSIKQNSKVLIQDILDVDMCLRKQNLKKIANLLKNKGVTAISVNGVFNKKFQICSTILRSNIICCMLL